MKSQRKHVPPSSNIPQNGINEDNEVRYWQLHQRHIPKDSNPELPPYEDEDENEYEIQNKTCKDILNNSTFHKYFMPSTDEVSESYLSICGSLPIRMGPFLLSALLGRFTEIRFNWETKTLQSFLEVACWMSVTYAAHVMYKDLLFALQIGTFVGALISVCNEISREMIRALTQAIRNHHGGTELLQRLGFDIPENGKIAPSDGREVTLIKNLVFGYFGVVVLRYLWENLHNVPLFAALSVGACVSFIVIAELFCLWLPTRRLGLTLQSRFTHIRQNWREHFIRSLIEFVCWTGSTYYYFYTSHNLSHSLQWGTTIGVIVCLLSGLTPLPIRDAPDTSKSQVAAMDFWNLHSQSDPYFDIANFTVRAQEIFQGVGQELSDEAMRMYENWGE